MKVDFTWDLLKTVRVFFFLSFPPLPLLPSLKVMNLLFTFRADVCSVCTFSDIIFFTNWNHSVGIFYSNEISRAIDIRAAPSLQYLGHGIILPPITA